MQWSSIATKCPQTFSTNYIPKPQGECRCRQACPRPRHEAAVPQTAAFLKHTHRAADRQVPDNRTTIAGAAEREVTAFGRGATRNKSTVTDLTFLCVGFREPGRSVRVRQLPAHRLGAACVVESPSPHVVVRAAGEGLDASLPEIYVAALHLAHSAFQRADALPSVRVPDLQRSIVGSRQDELVLAIHEQVDVVHTVSVCLFHHGQARVRLQTPDP